uniref:E3 ubiquitin-protein ligase ICP0 n=1 Tax=Noccaea caerulescens TaxID=107243 RepID=A0A1J3JPJ2_NOCCA
MSSSIQIVDVKKVEALSLQDQDEKKTEQVANNELSFGNHGGCCAICLNTIPLQETAMVKGCEHAYCVTCILRWASYKEKPTCPQCKHPFDFLNVHRTLDGSVEDFMFEESVCLLLRASWFQPLEVVVRVSDNDNYNHDFDIPPDYEEEDEEDDLDEFYMHGSSLRLGNRRWGDNGFVRAGRQEARPVQVQRKQQVGQASVSESGSSSSSQEPKEKTSAAATGRRAKRAMKREAANKAAEAVAAAKHEALLVRLGRK